MNFKTEAVKLVEVLKKYEYLLIFLKGSPDPDALGSAFALQALCRKLGGEARIETEKVISLAQNRALVKIAGIKSQVREKPYCREKCQAYGVLDHPLAFVSGLSEQAPCAFHLDHHQAQPKVKDVDADFRLLKSEAGATASLVALLLRDCGLTLDQEIMSTVATALIFAIQTDTDKYQQAGEIDLQALLYLTPLGNQKTLNHLQRIPYSQETMRLLQKSRENKVFYRDWLFCGLGFLAAAERDSLPLVADFLLRSNDVDLVAAFALISDEENGRMNVDVSLRTSGRRVDLPALLRSLSVEGGARQNKGAFQVPLDFFHYCPQPKKLWQVVESTVLALLKSARDRSDYRSLSGLWSRVKSFFKG